jgi:hypothetical protein
MSARPAGPEAGIDVAPRLETGPTTDSAQTPDRSHRLTADEGRGRSVTCLAISEKR